METQRRSEVTAHLTATAPDGRKVVIEQRTDFQRVRYTEGWSNWAPGVRTFWLGSEKLAVLDPCKLRASNGALLTLEPPGIG